MQRGTAFLTHTPLQVSTSTSNTSLPLHHTHIQPRRLRVFRRARRRTATKINTSLVQRGPTTAAPDYSSIDSNPFNIFFTRIFCAKLQSQLPPEQREKINSKVQKNKQDYATVIETVRQLSNYYRGRPSELNSASQRVIASLFPSWLPSLFVTLFSKPAPLLAARLNAIVTVLVTQWLMGPSRLDDGGTTVEIERCRYLEETGCVAICLHSCKAATEGYFENNMGIPLAIEPNLDDFSCKFQFGKEPLPKEDDEMYTQPCFTHCPSSSASPSKPSPEPKVAPCHATMEKKT